MIENPKKYYYVNKVLNGIESMTDDEDRVNKAFVNDFALDWIQLPINVTNPEGRQEPILFNPNLPFMDLNRIPNPSDITGSMQSLFSQSNPLLKIPVEQALNKNFFFDSPIVEEGDSQVANRVDHVASQFGMYGVATGLVQKKGLDKGLHILNNATGIKLLSYDYEKYKAIKIQELVQHGRKKNTEEKIKEYISDSMSNFGDTLVEGFKTEYSHAVNTFGDALYKDMPTKPSEYQGALRPLSQAKYDALSDIEKVKYTSPTAEDAIAYNKKALELYDEQMMQQSPGKRVIWAMFDGVEWGKRQQKFELGEVQEVADGDTFTIKVGDETKSVRLLLVDTPETVDPDVKKVMPYGKESSDYSKNHLMGKDVKIYFDNEETDKYGRTLAYVEIDGVDYNKLLLDEGLAQTRYIVEPPYKRLQDYLESEKEAYSNKKGLWSIDGYATPGIDDNYDTYNEAVKRWLEKK